MLRLDHVLDRVEHAVGPDAVDEGAGHVDPADVALDDQPRLEAAELAVDDLGELVGVFADAEGAGDALGGALEVRLDDHREGHVVERARLERGARDQPGAGRGHAVR